MQGKIQSATIIVYMGDRSGKFGWFLGMVIGTMLGVLFAPRKGKELRAKIRADRKKGKLGIAPLKDDFKVLGREMAAIAKDLYDSDTIQNLVETGRKKMHEMSDDWVDDVHDFHAKRIVPFQKEILQHVGTAKNSIKKGQATVKSASREWKGLKGKLKASAKIGRKAAKAISKTMKKKK